jgi:hypothetical protein
MLIYAGQFFEIMEEAAHKIAKYREERAQRYLTIIIVICPNIITL